MHNLQDRKGEAGVFFQLQRFGRVIMTNTKWLRRALLGGAALGVVATGAQADELSALKAQLAALQSRVSQLESEPTSALPKGASLLSIRKGQGSYAEILPMRASEQLRDHQGYTIAVTPTADMPAPVSEVTVSGEIRARLLFSDENVNNSDDDTLAANQGIDLDGDGSVTEASNALGFDTDNLDVTTRGRLRVDGKTQTAIGEVGGTIRLQGVDGTDDNWMVGAGIIGHLGDALRLEAAANMGNGYTNGIYGVENTGENDMGYWGANALAVYSFAGNLSLEADVGYTSLDHEKDELSVTTTTGGVTTTTFFVYDDQVDQLWSVGGALYWDPVDQLTLGWGAGWNQQSDNDGTDYTNITAGFGAWFRF